MKYRRPSSYLVLLVLSVSGCYFGPPLPPGLPRLTSTTLILTQEGTPLGGATVTLFSGEQQTWYPTGISDPNGRVELYTNGKYKGAPSGKYKMTVTKIYTEPSKHGPALEEGQAGYEEWLAKVSKETQESYSVVEKKYADVNTTSLEIEIPAKTRNFDLGKPVREAVQLEE